MKCSDKVLVLVFVVMCLNSCVVSSAKSAATVDEQPVVIANESLEYEIIIIDLGFNLFLNTIAHPPGYHTQEFLESRNAIFVTNWNYRVQNPSQFNTRIYENIIDYQSSIDYGYEVNYKLYNYFMFAQQKYRMNLGTGVNVRMR